MLSRGKSLSAAAAHCSGPDGEWRRSLELAPGFAELSLGRSSVLAMCCVKRQAVRSGGQASDVVCLPESVWPGQSP